MASIAGQAQGRANDSETVKMEVGTSGQGALNIETLQNTSTFESEQTSSGFNMSLCIPPICYGVPVTATVSLSNQTIDHNYISAVGQSGIAAGKGGFEIAVAGNTDLQGAAITSSSSSSITVGNDLGAMALGNLMANLGGKDGLPQNGSQSGQTSSVISLATVTSRSCRKVSASGATNSPRSKRTRSHNYTKIQASNRPLARIPIAQTAIKFIVIA